MNQAELAIPVFSNRIMREFRTLNTFACHQASDESFNPIQFGHWLLMIVSQESKEVLIVDSLGKDNPHVSVEALEELATRWVLLLTGEANFGFGYLDCTMQENNDCGPYALFYSELFLLGLHSIIPILELADDFMKKLRMIHREAFYNQTRQYHSRIRIVRAVTEGRARGKKTK